MIGISKYPKSLPVMTLYINNDIERYIIKNTFGIERKNVEDYDDDDDPINKGETAFPGRLMVVFLRFYVQVYLQQISSHNFYFVYVFTW